MRDLLVTAYTPTLGSGRALRVFGVLSALARHRPVHVLFSPFGGDEPAPEVRAIPDVTFEAVEAGRGVGRIAAIARAAVVDRMPLSYARGVSDALERRARELAGEVGRVVVDGPSTGGALLPLARRRPCVLLAQNVESSFRPEPGLATFERRLFETYAETWHCTPADVALARRMAPRARRLHVVPNAVDVDAVAVASPAPRAGRLLLVADYTYAPNRDAVAYLTGEVMPRVWARRPDVTVDVAGRGLGEPPADARVRAVGFVDDLRAAYAAADVVVVPVRLGGGSPLKLVEGLASGRPVVATAHAAGLLEQARDEEHLLVAADADAFAAAVLRILDDPGTADGLGAAGNALAREAFSLDAVWAAVAP